MKIYLNSYGPLISSSWGWNAVRTYHLHPYVDRSCRREPDFEATYPSITALCRGRLFAPRLRVGDTVVYITRQGRYTRGEESHWRLVAILNVFHRAESHEEAAEWYQSEGLPLPRNCMVAGNEPLPLKLTHVNPVSVDLKGWDDSYRRRAHRWGAFLICEKEFLELDHPPVITRDMMIDIFGRIPPTRNPPTISAARLDRLRDIAASSTGIAPLDPDSIYSIDTPFNADATALSLLDVSEAGDDADRPERGGGTGCGPVRACPD